MESLDLEHRLLGGPDNAPSIVLLHGLLGSSRNWTRAGQLLTNAYKVYALDLRNHGGSPHSTYMDYPSLAGDVVGWMESRGLERVHLVGHSMGGKVAMHLACNFPDKVDSLTVVDIAPRAYPPRWEKEFAVMKRMPVQHFTRRQQAEEWLSDEISDWAFRKFLVSNLARVEGGGFEWVVNLRILESALPNLFKQVPELGETYPGKVLFLRGDRSHFVEDFDLEMIREFFPAVEVVTIPEAGHNVHFDQPERLVEAITRHLA